MWWVYVLACQDKSLYTGIARDVEARYKAHLLGKGGAYTRSHKPIKVVYREEVETRSEALKREAEIKSWPRSRKLINLKLKGK